MYSSIRDHKFLNKGLAGKQPAFHYFSGKISTNGLTKRLASCIDPSFPAKKDTTKQSEITTERITVVYDNGSYLSINATLSALLSQEQHIFLWEFSSGQLKCMNLINVINTYIHD